MTVSLKSCSSVCGERWISCLIPLLNCGEDLDDLLFGMEHYAVSER